MSKRSRTPSNNHSVSVSPKKFTEKTKSSKDKVKSTSRNIVTPPKKKQRSPKNPKNDRSSLTPPNSYKRTERSVSPCKDYKHTDKKADKRRRKRSHSSNKSYRSHSSSTSKSLSRSYSRSLSKEKAVSSHARRSKSSSRSNSRSPTSNRSTTKRKIKKSSKHSRSRSNSRRRSPSQSKSKSHRRSRSKVTKRSRSPRPDKSNSLSRNVRSRSRHDDSSDDDRRGQFTVADRKRFWKLHRSRQEERDKDKSPPKEIKPPPGAVESTQIDDIEYGDPPEVEGPNFAELLTPVDQAIPSASTSKKQLPIPIKNDGSFLEMFKKMQEVTKKAEEAKKPEIKKPTLPFIGKRRGGRVLKTGLVKKAKAIDEQCVDNTPKDAWSLYMQEVKKYRETSCEEERKTRPLVK